MKCTVSVHVTFHSFSHVVNIATDKTFNYEHFIIHPLARKNNTHTFYTMLRSSQTFPSLYLISITLELSQLPLNYPPKQCY